MPRALVRSERQADGTFKPTTVFLGTRKGLQGKALPGDPGRDANLHAILNGALPPSVNDFTDERGTYEDWIGWALSNLSNGHTSWAEEVPPMMTVGQLYQRYVLDTEPKALTRPDLHATTEPPLTLGGYRKVTP